ncbi:MAG: immune inhibitor A [Chloroflexi bacterium]|nr:immune inhibitor A [Chloroflexota bacterium]
MIRAALFLLLALVVIACSDEQTPAPATGAAGMIAGTPSAATVTTAAPAPTAVQRPPLTGSGAVPTALQPEPPRADRFDLARRYRGVDLSPPRPGTASRNEQVGARRDFWVVQTDPPRAFQVSATLRAVSAHAYLYVQDDTGVSDADMRRAADDFENKVYPTVTRMFGAPAPAAVDPDPRITILHVRLPSVGGYFTDIDQLPSKLAPISNERRMIYIDLRAGPPGTATYPGLVAHEFQHLVHQGLNSNAEAWINEGLSEVANETVGGEAGTSLKAYRDAPGTQLTDWAASGSNAAHYGSSLAFLRYLLRHYGGLDRAGALAGTGGLGVNEVQKYLRDGNYGLGFEDVFADWLVAGYLNLPGDGRFSNPGADTRVRTLLRPGDGDDGDDSVNQFGADYFEISPAGRDLVFSFKGDTTIKQVPNDPASGIGQWWSGRGDSIDTTLTRTLDLRQVSKATVQFKTWFDIERGYDYGYVSISTDGGKTWQAQRGRQTTDFDPLGQAYGPGYTGVSGGGRAAAWVDESIDLTPFAGRQVLLRFEYIADEAAAAAGFAVDDITVPEIGYSDDAESDNGWQSSGFTRLTAPLAQRYIIQLVYDDGSGWKSDRVQVGADGRAEVRIPGNLSRAGVIVAGATYSTNLPASYRWGLDRAQR